MIRSRPIADSTASGTKRRNSATVAPATKPAFMMKFWPNTWKSGRKAARRSDERNRHRFAVVRTLDTTFACVRVTPFGKPVVPEEYSSTAGSSGSIVAARVDGSPRASQSSSAISSGSPPSHRTVCSTEGHSGRGRLGNRSAVVNTTFGRASFTM